MSLAYEIRRYVDRIRRQPSDGSDPRLLDRLEKMASEAIDGVVALMAPSSPMTWESVSILRGAVQTGPRVAFRFPRPVEIVGYFPSLVVLNTPSTAGIITPSLDTISCQIDTDNQNYMTSGDGVSTQAGGQAGPFVTLSSLSVQVPRVLGYKLRNPTPDIGFTFRWKQDIVSAGVGAPPAVYRDVIIGMSMFARYL